MAERRMFAKNVIESDLFLDMPQSSQLLYFHLSMRADDDGFINNPKSIMRNVGSKDDDIKLLIAKQFLIPFESGVVVIKHWKIHNYIRSDRYKPTQYKDEIGLLNTNENNEYEVLDTVGIPNDNQMDTQVRLGKVSIGKDSIEEEVQTKSYRFTKPTLEQLTNFIEEEKLNVDAQYFIDYYESNGWNVGKAKMKDWKATVRNWNRRNFTQNNYSKKVRQEIVTEIPIDTKTLSISEKEDIMNALKNLGKQ